MEVRRNCLSCDHYRSGGCRLDRPIEDALRGEYSCWSPRSAFLFKEDAEAYAKEYGYEGRYRLHKSGGLYRLVIDEEAGS